MRKILLFFILFSFFAQNINAQTEEELILEGLQNSYFTYLSMEGYNAKIEEDGDISFKQEGKTYYITPYDEYTFEVSRYVELSDGDACSKIYQMINDFHFTRANERALAYEGCDLIQIQSFSMLNEKNDWKGILNGSMLWLDNGVEGFLELYNELQ
tara:strand:- start:2021 stop:2488 length:468 start_codon:yes stop_codon:yes gene_type:complete